MTDETPPGPDMTDGAPDDEAIDTTDGSVAVQHGRIDQVDLQLEMQRSYLTTR